jgi:hypothetical protein
VDTHFSRIQLHVCATMVRCADQSELRDNPTVRTADPTYPRNNRE